MTLYDDYEPHVALNAAEWEDQEAHDALATELDCEWAMLADLIAWEREQAMERGLTLDELAASNPNSMPF